MHYANGRKENVLTVTINYFVAAPNNLEFFLLQFW